MPSDSNRILRWPPSSAAEAARLALAGQLPPRQWEGALTDNSLSATGKVRRRQWGGELTDNYLTAISRGRRRLTECVLTDNHLLPISGVPY